jgi:hypothetical protein
VWNNALEQAYKKPGSAGFFVSEWLVSLKNTIITVSNYKIKKLYICALFKKDSNSSSNVDEISGI